MWAQQETTSRHNQLKSPPAELVREIRELQPKGRALNDPHSPALKTFVLAAQNDLSKFIVRTINENPSISACELESRIAIALSVKHVGCDTDVDTFGPHVFAHASVMKTAGRRIFVVAYNFWLGFYGPGGYETILENYDWEPQGGAVRKSASAPQAFSGIITESEEVYWFPDSNSEWILVSGKMSGASGMALPGSAAVFEIGPHGQRTVWAAPPSIGNVSAFAHTAPPGPRWEIDYVDLHRFDNNLPASNFLDIYQVDVDKHSYQQIVHRSF